MNQFRKWLKGQLKYLDKLHDDNPTTGERVSTGFGVSSSYAKRGDSRIFPSVQYNS